jgi:hypothetical protein
MGTLGRGSVGIGSLATYQNEKAGVDVRRC